VIGKVIHQWIYGKSDNNMIEKVYYHWNVEKNLTLRLEIPYIIDIATG
jgi:hypothetical protein